MRWINENIGKNNSYDELITTFDVAPLHHPEEFLSLHSFKNIVYFGLVVDIFKNFIIFFVIFFYYFFLLFFLLFLLFFFIIFFIFFIIFF